MQEPSFSNRIPLHKYLLYGWLENLDTVRHIPLGRFWNIPVSITPLIWASPLVFLTIGILQNFRAPGVVNAFDVAYLALVYLVGVEITTLFHAFGHILGGKLVGSPMDELLLTATRGVNIYHGDQTHLPSRIHLGRALGGPLFNLLVAAVLYLILPYMERGIPFDLITSLASTNLFFGVFSFLPLPSVDGQVIWREIIRSLR
jgi:Zn-dependent protease